MGAEFLFLIGGIMATILLIIIYIDFVGLGLPDSLFGTAWPVIYPEFGLQLSMANCVTLLVTGCTIVSSLLSARLINRFGTAKVTAVSTMLTALALLGFSVSGNLWWMCLCALPLGFGAGAIDSGLNNYVALHYNAMHMNFLHCAYGAGIALSPYIMSTVLGRGQNWRIGYRCAFFIQLSITLVTVVSVPLWAKMQSGKAEQSDAPKTLSIAELAKMPTVRAVWLLFIGSCAIECTAGTWGSTFMVNSKGLAPDAAARQVMIYYLGLTFGRILAGVFSKKLTCWRIIVIGQLLVFPALVLMILPLPLWVSSVALFLVGMGIGPVIPNINHLTPQIFGRDISMSVMGSQMAAVYTGLMIMPAVYGWLAQSFSTDIFPYFLAVMFLVMMAAMTHLALLIRREGIQIKNHY